MSKKKKQPTPHARLFPVTGIVCYVEGLPYTSVMMTRREARIREFIEYRAWVEGREWVEGE